jgi:hypothetical protein
VDSRPVLGSRDQALFAAVGQQLRLHAVRIGLV